MKIALIYPRLHNCQEHSFGICGYNEIMRGYPPLSLAYVAAIIRKAGHEVIIIDGNILNLGLKQMLENIKGFSPDMIGFTVTTGTFHKVRRWIGAIKEATNIPVIIGGALLELYPNEIMHHKEIDYGIIGTGIEALPRFLNNLKNKKDLSGIEGLCFRKNGGIVINEKKDPEEDINVMPSPARELLPNHKYYAPFSQKKHFTAVVTSRGCAFKCLYCCLPGQLQLRKADDVMNEIEECYHRFNIRDIDIYDSVFTVNRKRAVDICRGIRVKGLKLSWRARTHISLIDKELLEEMALSGCKMIMYGIESVDSAILKNLGRKPLSVDQFKHKIEMTKKTGISPFGFFMLGSPGETYYTMKNTVQASRNLGLDFVQFSKFTVIPGTRLYKRYISGHNEDPWRRFILHKGRHNPVINESNLSPDILMRQVKKANIAFYLRPLHIIKIDLSIKSPRQLINYIKAGLGMLLSYLRGQH